MKQLSIADFAPQVASYASGTLLSPGDASKLTLMITELMLDHNVDYNLLKFLSRFLTPQSYDELIEERNIEHECGYIVCDQSPKRQVRRLSANSNGTTTANGDPQATTKFQIYNRKPSIILPNTFLSQFCCKEHYQASLFYRNQLKEEALFAREHILTTPPFSPSAPPQWYENGIKLLEEVLQKHEELRGLGKTLSDVITMMNGMHIADNDNKDTSNLIQLLEDFDIVEKEGGLDGDSAIVDEEDEEDVDNDSQAPFNNDLSRSIDGYVTSNKSFGGYVV